MVTVHFRSVIRVHAVNFEICRGPAHKWVKSWRRIGGLVFLLGCGSAERAHRRHRHFEHGLTVVTRNVSHFEPAAVPVRIQPWGSGGRSRWGLYLGLRPLRHAPTRGRRPRRSSQRCWSRAGHNGEGEGGCSVRSRS